MVLICALRGHLVSQGYTTTTLPEVCPACVNGVECNSILVHFDGRKHTPGKAVLTTAPVQP